MASEKKSSTSFHSTSIDLPAFFGACSGFGEVFTVARNDYLLVGSIADPIRYIRQGRMRLLDAGALQINHSRRFTLVPAPAVQSCACRVVEGMDFVNRHGEGFLTRSFRRRPSSRALAGWWKGWILSIATAKGF